MASVIALKIEGIGLGSSDVLYRFATGVIDNDSSGVYLDGVNGLDGDSLPSQIGVSVDFREGTSTVGGVTVSLLAGSVVRRSFCHANTVPLAKLTKGISATITAIELDTTGLAGQTIVLGNECIYLSVDLGGGDYSCDRGVLGTRAQIHGTPTEAVDDTVDVDCYDAIYGPVLTGRRAWIVVVDQGGDYADEQVLLSGILSGDIVYEGGRVTLTLNAGDDLLRGRLVCNDLWRGQLVADYGVSEGGAAFGYGHGAYGRLVGVDDTLLSIGGGAVVRLVDAAGTSRPLIVEGSADTIGFPSSRYASAVPWDNPPQEAWQCYSTSRQAPQIVAGRYLGREDGRSPNLVDLTLQILTTTPEGGNGDYDLGVGDLGLGVPAGLVDVARFEAVREQLGPLLDRESSHWGVDGKPVDAYDKLQSEWMAAGGVITQGRDGLISVAILTDAAFGTVETIGAAELLDTPIQRRRLIDVVDEVVLEYSDIPGTGTTKVTARDVVNRRRSLHPRHSQDVLQAPGLEDVDLARAVVEGHIQRYHRPITEYDVVTVSSVDLWPGELVQLTCGDLIDSDGLFGVTSAVCIVVSRQYTVEAEEIAYTLWDVGEIYNKRRAWAPSAKVASISSATVLVVEDNEFTSGAGYYSTDGAAIGSKVEVDVRDGDDLSTITSGVKIDSRSGSTLTFNSAHGASVGDIITLGAYDDLATLGDYWRGLYAHMADDDDELGAAGDIGAQWGF